MGVLGFSVCLVVVIPDFQLVCSVFRSIELVLVRAEATWSCAIRGLVRAFQVVGDQLRYSVESLLPAMAALERIA